MIQVLIVLFAIYWILVIYLEYLVSKLYKQLCKDPKSGLKMFFIGYRKKINCLEELKEKHIEVEKALSVDRIIKKLSLLMIVLVLILIVTQKF
jgi:hypothetical protein